MYRYRRSTTTSATLCLCDCVRWQEATNPSPFPASSRLVGLGLISSRREGTAALHHHLKTTLLVLLRCNSDVSFPILRYLNRAIISWGMGDWGRPPFWPPPPFKYAIGHVSTSSAVVVELCPCLKPTYFHLVTSET